MNTGRKILAAALLLVGLVAVNYLASAIPARLDATAERIYSLSPGTRALLGRLEDPVKLEFYFSRSAAGLPIAVKNYAARVQEMLRAYVRASGGKLQLVVVDPKPDTPTEEGAVAARLDGQPTPSGDAVYFGLVATQADQQKVISYFNPQREQFLEYDLSELIHSVQLFDKRRLGLISGLPLRPQMDMMAMQMGRMPQSQVVVTQWEKSFEIVPVEANATELPANLDALAVVHPTGLGEPLQFAIDQFLLSGKPVLVAIDPSSRHMAGRSRQPGMFGGPQPGASSDLPALLGGWGLAYNPAEVVGDLENGTQVQTAPGRISRFPVWISLDADNLSRTAPPTSQLESLLFVEPGAVSLKPGTANLTFTPLIETSAQAGTVPAMTMQFAQPDDVSRQLKVNGRKTLAALVQGKFKSAFPQGAPAKEAKDATAPGQEGAKPAAPADPAKPALAESKTNSTLLLVADTDWLVDDYSVRRFNFMGVQAAEPINDNLSFASNAVEFLSGSQDLISIRGKGSSIRPFKVVKQMEAAAQRKFQQQLTALESRLSQVQTKLTELQGRRTEGNRLVATPEVTKAIDDFQRQQAAMRGERRQIRAALRADIERLENLLLAANLLAPVFLVGVFGLWFRHRRSR